MPAILKILLAEDSDEDADLFHRALRVAGIECHVFRVTDGHEAVEYLEGTGSFADRIKYPFPDVVISDLKMPRMNGLELLAWLRDHPKCSVIPAILLTGSCLTKDVEAAYGLGANTFFEKPSNFHDLVHLLKSLYSYWSHSQLPAVGWT